MVLVKRVNNIFRARGRKWMEKKGRQRERERERKNGLYRRITGREGEKASFIELVKEERRTFEWRFSAVYNRERKR